MSSGISRLQKLIHVLTSTSSLSDAGKLRQKPIWVLAHQRVYTRAAILLRPLIATAVRSCLGPIEVRVDGDDSELALIKQVAEFEARQYGSLDRLNVQAFYQSEAIGPGIALGCEADNLISVDATGLLASINGYFAGSVPPPHASAACFAVAAGFAKYFNATVLGKDTSKRERWVMDLGAFDTQYPEAPDLVNDVAPINLGIINLLGAGAIGSAFAYALNLSDDSATLVVVDKDRYEEPNQETTFFLNQAGACRYNPKAEALAAACARTTLNAMCLPMQEIKAGSEFIARACDVFVCAVDNVDTRKILDSVNASLTINAGLGSTRLDAGHILCTWHTADTSALSSIYAGEEALEPLKVDIYPTEIKDDCSRVAYESVTLATPFIALAAGALLLGLCHRRVTENLPDVNYIKLDLLGQQHQMSRHFI